MCFICGCKTVTTLLGPEPIRCPQCNADGNISAPDKGPKRAKQRTWLEVCFVPLLPLGSEKDIATCKTCNWEAKAPPQPPQQQYGPAQSMTMPESANGQRSMSQPPQRAGTMASQSGPNAKSSATLATSKSGKW